MKGLLIRDAHKPVDDITGLVRKKGSQIVCDDTFERDACGVVQLRSTGPQSTGTLNRINRGGWHMQLRTANRADQSAMMLKRMSQDYGEGEYLVEMWTHSEKVNLDDTRPRYKAFGLDSARWADGVRFFHNYRMHIYDQALAALVWKWQVQLAGGSWADIPGGVIPTNGGSWPDNENKKMPQLVALHVNTRTGAYLGFRHGNWCSAGTLKVVPDGSGVLVPAPNNTDFAGMVAGATPSPLTIFAGGLNPFIEIVNRSVSLTGAVQGLQRQRLTKVG